MNADIMGKIVDAAVEMMVKIAADRGSVVTAAEILSTIALDPKGATARRFAELVALGIETVVNATNGR